jgi:hypothetical protein
LHTPSRDRTAAVAKPDIRATTLQQDAPKPKPSPSRREVLGDDIWRSANK